MQQQHRQLGRNSTPHPMALLTVYFSSERTLGEQSALGPMIARLQTYGEKKRACTKCQGLGTIPNKAYAAWLERRREYDAGLLGLLREEFETKTPFEAFRPPPNQERQCYRCKGACEVPVRQMAHEEVTAWPTGSSEQLSNAREPDYDGLLVLAAASRVMMRLSRSGPLGPQHCRTLEAYHSRAGDWFHSHLGNRIFAVAALFPEVLKRLQGTDTEAALKALRGWSTNPDQAAGWALIEARAQRALTQATRAWAEVCNAI